MSGRGAEVSGQQPVRKETSRKAIEQIGVAIRILDPYKAYCLGRGWTVGNIIFGDLKRTKQYSIETEEKLKPGWDSPVTVLTETGEGTKRVTEIRRDVEGNIVGIMQTFAGPGETGNFTAVTRVGTYAEEMAVEVGKGRGIDKTSPPCFWQRLICGVSEARDIIFNGRTRPWEDDMLGKDMAGGSRVFAQRVVARDRSWSEDTFSHMPAIKN